MEKILLGGVDYDNITITIKPSAIKDLLKDKKGVKVGNDEVLAVINADGRVIERAGVSVLFDVGVDT